MKKILNFGICIWLSIICISVQAQSSPIEQDKVSSIEEVTKQAESGNPQSQLALASIYMKGQDVPKDEALAYVWLKKSAEQGLAQAQYHVGAFHLQGSGGVAKDASIAASWFKKAADQGNASAQYIISLMYADGDGVPKNEMLSEKYMREAAINGVPQAQVIEGKRYKAGINTSVDPIIAYAYFNVAASVESPIKSDAISLRDGLIKTFSNDDKITAQTLSTQFSTIGILKALDQYIVEVKKRENEALAAKIAAEKTAQEEAAREAERVAHEEKMALIIEWAKKIGFVILGLITVGGLGILIRKHFKTHKSATEFLKGAKVDEGISAIKDKTTKFANVIASDIQTIKEGGHSAMEESQKTDLPSTDQKINAVKILWSKLNFQQRLILLLPIIVVAFVFAKSFGGSQVTDERFLVESFKIKNPGINIRKYSKTSFVSGTVPARSVGFAEDSRLKATMGCFDWVYSMPGDLSETESYMCIYYVYGPNDGGGRIWWRGDKEWLLGLMEEQGFKP